MEGRVLGFSTSVDNQGNYFLHKKGKLFLSMCKKCNSMNQWDIDIESARSVEIREIWGDCDMSDSRNKQRGKSTVCGH